MFKKFKKIKDDGISGLNRGIPFGLDRFNKYIPGVMRERLYLLGGGSGAGKSKVINELFVFTVFDDWLAKDKSYPLEIHYFSLEMTESQIIAELAARWIHKTQGLLVDSQYLLSYWVDYKLSPFINEMLESNEFKQYIDDFNSCVKIIDTTLNSTTFSMYMNKLAEDSGTVHTKSVLTKENREIKIFTSYDDNDDNQLIMVILDHISLVKNTSGQTDKSMLGAMADTMIRARNRYKFSFVVTQQLNRAFNSTGRTRLDDILPKDSDFRGGADIFDAANVVLGLLSPKRERQTSFLGFKVADSASGKGFGNKLIILNIIKNRHGQAFTVFPLLFLGETGELFELPKKADDYNLDNLKKYTKYYLKQ